MTKKRINARIKDTGLTVVGTRGDGYFYFIDAIGNQVGLSVYVCYLNQLSLDEWAYEAQKALASASAPSDPPAEIAAMSCAQMSIIDDDVLDLSYLYRESA